MRFLLVLILLLVALRCAHVDAPKVSAAPETASESTESDDARILGKWQAFNYTSDSESYAMDFQSDGFRADHGDEWYTGQVHLWPDTTPARIDFEIEDTNGSWGNQTSTGIYTWDGDTLVISAPAPGEERPSEILPDDGHVMRLRRQ